MLCRRWIHEHLYSAKGYFADPVSPIVSGHSIDFNALVGMADYKRAEQALYRDSGHWLTPAELFQPYYSQAIAHWLIHVHAMRNTRLPMRIFEVGAGNGTNAVGVLDLIKRQRPDLYAHVRYDIVEISPALAVKQQQWLAKAHPGKVAVHNADFLQWRTRVDGPVAVVALEVLDNLPHDKVIMSGTPRESWQQVSVVEDASTGTLSESAAPLTDALTLRACALFPPQLVRHTAAFTWNPVAYMSQRGVAKVKQQRAAFEIATSRQQAAFVPSGCVQLLDVLADCFPAHALLAADFAVLPLGNHDMDGSDDEPGSLRGCLNSPIVSSRLPNGELRDHTTYLVKDSADIYFQTDFEKLNEAWKTVTGKRQGANVHSSASFLSRFAGADAIAKTTTRNGYNPMLEDYANTNIFTAHAV